MPHTKPVHANNRLQECRQIAASRRQRGYTGGGLDLYGEGDAEAHGPAKAHSIEDEGEVATNAQEDGDAEDGPKHARRSTSPETNENEVVAAAAAPQDDRAEKDTRRAGDDAAAAAEDNGEAAASADDAAESSNAVPASRAPPTPRDWGSPQAAADENGAEAEDGQQATHSAPAADEEEKGGYWLAPNDLGCCSKIEEEAEH